MGKTTGIGWTDSTWNPVRGCSKVSPGCRSCYAEKVAVRFSGPGLPYEGLADPTTGLWTGRVRMVPERLADPLRWQKPRRIFVNSMSDLFHEALSIEDIAAIFGVMALACHHTFQVLTKRADRMREVVSQLTVERILDAALALDVHISRAQTKAIRDALPKGSPFAHDSEAPMWPLPNVWLGVSVEDQQRADERIPLLVDTPAAVRFISAEPLLGPVDLTRWINGEVGKAVICTTCSLRKQPRGRSAPLEMANSLCDHECPGYSAAPDPGQLWPGETAAAFGYGHVPQLHWVIVGGESGGGARQFERAWATSILEQCSAANVACFVKQLGAFVVDRNDAGFQGNDMEHFPDGDCWDIRDLDAVEDNINGFREEHQGAPVRIRLQDRAGADPAEWPAHLRVQQFPKLNP